MILLIFYSGSDVDNQLMNRYIFYCDKWRDGRPSESGGLCFQCASGFEFEQSETLVLACAGQSRIAAVAMRGKLPAFRQTVPAEEAVEAE